MAQFLQAAAADKLLGWDTIECVVIDADEHQAAVWEIVENLHRTNMSALERAKMTAELVALCAPAPIEEKVPVPAALFEQQEQGGQVGHPVERHGRVQEPSGVAKAARELGKPRTTIRRDLKIASITPRAEAAAIDRGRA